MILADDVGWAGAVPINGARELGKVERPMTLGGEAEHADGVGENGTFGWAGGVPALAEPEDDRAD